MQLVQTSTLDHRLCAAEDHLTARHHVRHRAVLHHRHRHSFLDELARRGVAGTVGVRLRHHDAEVLGLGGGEEESDQHAGVSVSEDDRAVVDQRRAELRDLRARIEARACEGLAALDKQPLHGLEVGEVLHLLLDARDKADEELTQRPDRDGRVRTALQSLTRLPQLVTQAHHRRGGRAANVVGERHDGRGG